MIVGIDFDNTLVCYEGMFHAAAVALGILPAAAPADRAAIRELLRRQGRERDFTRLQGHVYGPGLTAARPWPGVRRCLDALRARGAHLFVVSHKTPCALEGPPHDLHMAAHNWLESMDFFINGRLRPEDVFLETSRQAKLARIAALGCTHFIDDLPEFLAEPSFPHGVERILFAPGGAQPSPDWTVFGSWPDIQRHLLGRARS